MNRLQLGVAALGALVSAALPKRVRSAVFKGVSLKAGQLVLSLQTQAVAATTLDFEGMNPHEWTCTASDPSVIAVEVIPSVYRRPELTLRIRTLKRGMSRLQLYSTALGQGAYFVVYVA